MGYFRAANQYQTELVNDINATQVVIEVADLSGAPELPFKLSVESEIVNVVEVVGTLLTVERGAEGTTPSSHPEGSVLQNKWTAGTYKKLCDSIEVHKGEFETFKSNSYFYRETLYFTSSGDFKKADFPWLRAIRVKCQGAGGAGGSIQNGTGVSGAGSGGGYAESFIADIESLPDTVQVTVGAGGTTVTGGDGNPGGDSSFGSIVEATGGGGGGSNGSTSTPGAGTGDFNINGGWGTPGGSGTDFPGGVGGSSYMGSGGAGRRHGANGSGSVGRGYGGGGGACRQGTSGTATGGNGADGIVIVELYS